MSSVNERVNFFPLEIKENDLSELPAACINQSALRFGDSYISNSFNKTFILPDKNDCASPGNTNQQQGVTISMIPNRSQPVQSDYPWREGRYHGGAILQQTGILEKRECSHKQLKCKMRLQQFKAVEEEINNLKILLHSPC